MEYSQPVTPVRERAPSYRHLTCVGLAQAGRWWAPRKLGRPSYRSRGITRSASTASPLRVSS